MPHRGGSAAQRGRPGRGAAVVAILVLAAVSCASSHRSAGSTRPARAHGQTFRGSLSTYYSTDCTKLEGTTVDFRDGDGHLISSVAKLTWGTRTFGGTSCSYSFTLTGVRLSSGADVSSAPDDELDTALGPLPVSSKTLLELHGSLEPWFAPNGDQAAIKAVWARVNAANAVSPTRGLQALASVGWPTGAWTPQMIVCPSPGTTLAQALRKVISPGAVVDDVPDVPSLQPTPGWSPDAGPGAGKVPPGRIYTLFVDSSQTGTPGGGEQDHVVISPDGTAHLFPRACGTPLRNGI